MKKLLLISLLFICSTSIFAQNEPYHWKLYYTCKVWGFIKYNHPRVAACLVDWDKVLLKRLPLIKYSQTNHEFNDLIDSIIISAGNIGRVPGIPDTLPVELKRNRNLNWIRDPVFRADISSKLDSIKSNFKKLSNNCWVEKSGNSNKGWLEFPHDDPCVDSDFYLDFPDEYTRLLAIFKYWNIINYFNPYNYILDKPWDSTLYNSILKIAEAKDYVSFFKVFKNMASDLADAHVEGLTGSDHYFIRSAYFRPRLILNPSKNDIVVKKSDYPEISRGDVTEEVDGLTVQQWRDSLKNYISAGNPNVFNRFLALYLVMGDSSSKMNIKFRDKEGILQSDSFERKYKYDQWFLDHHVIDTLIGIEWKKLDCNIGYVNMGIMKIANVDQMYSELKTSKAIIFDLRYYPSESVISYIANKIYPSSYNFVKFTIPDVYYPGTHSWSYSYTGIAGNQDYYKGKVIILCNQQTQSHAEYCCMALRGMVGSVVVGNQTAGADGNVTRFRLTKDIAAGFTTLGIFYPDGTETQRIGIVPDSIVYPTPEGIRDGRDEILEKAMEIAGCALSVDVKDIEERNFSIKPNPASDFIEISGVNHTLKGVVDGAVRIYNTLGECIINLAPTLSEGEGERVDVSGLPTGVYFVRFRDYLYKFLKI
jgi:hypothetical protein